MLINRILKRHTYLLCMCSLLLITALSLTGCSGKPGNNASENPHATQAPVAKEIICEDLSITLTSDYIESASENYTMCYSNNNSIFIGVRDDKEDLIENQIPATTLDEYTSVIEVKEGLTIEAETYNDNTRCLTWDKEFNGKDYSFTCFITESEGAFWLIQFACLTNEYDNMSDKFYEFYDSVKLDGNTNQ